MDWVLVLRLRVLSTIGLLVISVLGNAASSSKNKYVPLIGKTSRDSLFAYDQPIIICNDPIKVKGCENQCSYMKVNYHEMTHVNGRDEIPAKKAKSDRVDLNGVEAKAIEIPYAKGGKLSTFEVGNPGDKACKFATIFG
jgi:hypothetical protein